MGETLTQQQVTALIEEHLPLVSHVVFQVAVNFPRHVEREELARAGALGLVEAAKRFDESRGVPFNRFAAQRIRGAIIDAVRAADWAPRSVRALARSLDQAELELANRLGRAPSVAETATELTRNPALHRLLSILGVARLRAVAMGHGVGKRGAADADGPVLSAQRR